MPLTKGVGPELSVGREKMVSGSPDLRWRGEELWASEVDWPS